MIESTKGDFLMDKKKISELADGLNVESIDEESKIVVLSVPEQWEGHGASKPLFATARNAIQEQGFKAVLCQCTAWRGVVVIDGEKMDLANIDDKQLAEQLNAQIRENGNKSSECYREAAKQMENSPLKKKMEETQKAYAEAKNNRDADKAVVYGKISDKKKELQTLEYTELFKEEAERMNAEFAERGIKIVDGSAYFEEMDPKADEAQKEANEAKYFPRRIFENSIYVKNVTGNKVVFGSFGGSSIPDSILPEAIKMMKEHGFENGLITVMGHTYELGNKTVEQLREEFKESLDAGAARSEKVQAFEKTDKRAKKILAEIGEINKEFGAIDANISNLDNKRMEADREYHSETARLSSEIRTSEQNKELEQYGYKCDKNGVPVKDNKSKEIQPGE